MAHGDEYDYTTLTVLLIILVIEIIAYLSYRFYHEGQELDWSFLSCFANPNEDQDSHADEEEKGWNTTLVNTEDKNHEETVKKSPYKIKNPSQYHVSNWVLDQQDLTNKKPKIMRPVSARRKKPAFGNSNNDIGRRMDSCALNDCDRMQIKVCNLEDGSKSCQVFNPKAIRLRNDRGVKTKSRSTSLILPDVPNSFTKDSNRARDLKKLKKQWSLGIVVFFVDQVACLRYDPNRRVKFKFL